MEVKSKQNHRKLLPMLFFMGAALITGPALAKTACRNNMVTDIHTNFVKKLWQKLHFDNVVFAVCKASPVHIGMTYAMFLTPHNNESCKHDCNYDLAFLLSDNSGNKIKYLYTKENAFHFDVRSIRNISLDTGFYQLNPFLRAAGFRIEKRKPLYTSQSYASELHLFVEDGKSYRPLFLNEETKVSQSLAPLLVKESAKTRQKKYRHDSCHLHRSEAARMIELGTYHNGFRDLIIKTQVVDIMRLKVKDGCAEQPIAQTIGETVIPYDGSYYRLPKWLFSN